MDETTFDELTETARIFGLYVGMAEAESHETVDAATFMDRNRRREER